MNEFAFKWPAWGRNGLRWQDVDAAVWLENWAVAGSAGDDNQQYFELIEKPHLCGGDIQSVGLWKEGCKEGSGRWSPGCPTGFEVWMKASTVAMFPSEASSETVISFLDQWRVEKFTASKNPEKPIRQSFGLSRASTLLHFVSRARYPIFDRRVAEAMRRLGANLSEVDNGDEYYREFLPAFNKLAERCKIDGYEALRKLDNALFNLGAYKWSPVDK